MKKEMIFVAFVVLLVFLINSVFAINLEVTSSPVSNSVITDLEEPAVFNLFIENKGESDSFEIYSLVGVDMLPEETFYIGSGETKEILLRVLPQSALQNRKGFFTFEYLIKNSLSEIQRETLTINIVDLESAFEIVSENINPGSESAVISIKNTVSRNFNNIKLKSTSAFFESEESFSLNGFEKKEIVVPIDADKVKSINAGSYLVSNILEVEGKKVNKESMVRFLEQEGIDSDELFSGWIKREQVIIKHNVGNVRKKVSVSAERNLISSFFTSFNINPSDSYFTGFKRAYVWEKELVPNEEFKVIVVTNWFYPFFVILLIWGLIFFYKKSVAHNLILSKKVSFVKTKGGQFALKVMLRVKSKGFVERINVIDKLPPLVELYDKFGAIVPDDIDLKNRRIEWEIESLNKGEERVFSYIIYSKIGVIGRFELPSARVVYEKDGKIKEVGSNRAFFINDSKDG